MTDYSHSPFIVRATLVSILCLGPALSAVAQQPAPPAHPTTPDDQTMREAQPEYPSLHIAGFGDVDFAAVNRNDGARGFTEGQFTLHMVSALSPRIAFFGEVTFTPRLDAGTGSPAATGFNAEVERAIIRFDQSDALKVSFGRYHTPINWWNTAFHHGQWLQTSISRPEMVQFGGRFIPSTSSARSWKAWRRAAAGTSTIRQGSATDAAASSVARATPATTTTSPPCCSMCSRGPTAPSVCKSGHRHIPIASLPSDGPTYNERIVAGHAVWQHENPEVIAEIADVRHTQVGTSVTTSSLAYYVQAAYRLPAPARLWKPYYRFEHIDIDSNDVVFADVPNLDVSIFGVRYDISTYVCIKTEGRIRRRAENLPWTNGWFSQIAFTF
jgi:hypothetical protein